MLLRSVRQLADSPYAFGGRIAIASTSSRKAGLARRGICSKVLAGSVLEAILYRGELPRSEVASLLGQTSRHARRVVADLIERGVLAADSPRAHLRLAFPAALASRWMPGLFPEQLP